MVEAAEEAVEWRQDDNVPNNNNTHFTATVFASRRTQRSRTRTRAARTIAGFYTAAATARISHAWNFFFFAFLTTVSPTGRPIITAVDADTAAAAAADRIHRSAHSVAHTQKTRTLTSRSHRHRSDGAEEEAVVILTSEY